MGQLSSRVTRELMVQVVSPAVGPRQVPVALRYDTADPFALHAVFHNPHGDDVPWVFARELLAQGVEHLAGEGDVRVWPWCNEEGSFVRIVLISPDGEALLQAPAEALTDFLDNTYRLCPQGGEQAHLDLDEALAELLAS